MKKKMKKNMKKTLPRNWFAIHAHNRTGAGNHGDKKKEQSKKACRKYKWKG